MTTRCISVASVPFEAARYVDILPDGHRSKGIHGHSFKARAWATLPDGWADFPGDESMALRRRLESCIAPLDYSLLNDHLEIPTDENLARWIRQRLQVPGTEIVSIQSTSDQGVDLDNEGRAHIWRRFRFEAAHRLPNVREDHKCGRMHGHGFDVVLHANQEIDNLDMGVDFDYLSACWAPLRAELNYACLNDIRGLENPTSEILAAWIWDRIHPNLPQLSSVTVYETATAGCHYRPGEFRIWKEQSFEAAVRLKRAPTEDCRHTLHGHSYITQLHLTASLDDVLGWTVDYGDVKELFKPVYQQLDHHQLDELNSLDSPDCKSLLYWMRDRVRGVLPQLNRLDLYETPGCGGVLLWGNSHASPTY